MGWDVGDDDRRSELGRFEDWKREPFMERWHDDRLRSADQLGKVLVRHAPVDHHPMRLEAEPDHEINEVDRLLVQDVSDDDQSQIPTVTGPRPNEPGGGGGEVLVGQAVAQGEHVPLERQAERPQRTGPTLERSPTARHDHVPLDCSQRRELVGRSVGQREQPIEACHRLERQLIGEERLGAGEVRIRVQPRDGVQPHRGLHDRR